MANLVHHKCGRKVTLIGERVGDALCPCAAKPASVHHQFGCFLRLKPGAKVTKYLRAVTCGKCIRELHIEDVV
jgi:hypothetical protein